MIQASGLEKWFGGRRVLGPISFTIADGETVGFLGLNGAGKTTALRILACDLRPSAGSVRIDDADAVENPHAVRRHVGFLPETPPLYPEMRVGEFLRFAGRLRGMDPGALEGRLREVAARTHVEDVLDEPIRNLSHGYRQRVGVAQAVIHRPKLLILDEPTRGLDPVQIVEMRQMIHDLKADHTVLISSHILPEISETCDRLLVLGEGTIAAAGTEEELAHRLTGTRHIVVGVRPRDGLDQVLADLRGLGEVVEVTPLRAEDAVHELEVAATSDIRETVCRTLVEKGHGVVRLDLAQHKLESIFLDLVKGDPGARN